MSIKSKKIIQSILTCDKNKYEIAKQCIESLQSIILSGDKFALQHSTKASLVILNKILQSDNTTKVYESNINDTDIFDFEDPEDNDEDTNTNKTEKSSSNNPIKSNTDLNAEDLDESEHEQSHKDETEDLDESEHEQSHKDETEE